MIGSVSFGAPRLFQFRHKKDRARRAGVAPPMGELLDRMVDAGANRNMNISFSYSKLDELLDQARTNAVGDARKKANLYVTTAGANLGDVLSISDTPYLSSRQMIPVDAMALREGKASLPIAAGEQQLSVTVTVRWAIDNHHLEPVR